VSLVFLVQELYEIQLLLLGEVRSNYKGIMAPLLFSATSLVLYIAARHFDYSSVERRSLVSSALGAVCATIAEFSRIGPNLDSIELYVRLVGSVLFIFGTGVFFRAEANGPIDSQMSAVKSDLGSGENDNRPALFWSLSFISGFALGAILIISKDTLQKFSQFHLIWYFSSYCASGVLATLNSTRVWRWGIGVGIGFLLSSNRIVVEYLTNSPVHLSMMTSSVFSFGALLGAFGGALSGWLFRKGLDSVRKYGWKSFWP
jgi:hypothetical protein